MGKSSNMGRGAWSDSWYKFVIVLLEIQCLCLLKDSVKGMCTCYYMESNVKVTAKRKIQCTPSRASSSKVDV